MYTPFKLLCIWAASGEGDHFLRVDLQRERRGLVPDQSTGGDSDSAFVTFLRENGYMQ